MNKPLDYQTAGVNIDAGNALVDAIQAHQPHHPAVLSGIGGFGALYELPTGYQQPVLVSGTDGVGTKLKLAHQLNQHHSIGIDLVAMCVNDILTQGATPLFFLDYYATGRLDPKTAQAVIAGIQAGCQQTDMVLIGGETAEMPGFYAPGQYDLAGFCVGIVEKAARIQAERVSPGDCLLALPSSGPHANGYSLIHHIIDTANVDITQPWGTQTLGEYLLTPTTLYVKAIQALMTQIQPHGMAHITGGGLLENIPRMLPKHCCAKIDLDSWDWPPIFKQLQAWGPVDQADMLRTFNCGVGYVVCVQPADAENAVRCLTECGMPAWILGSIVAQDASAPSVSFQ